MTYAYQCIFIQPQQVPDGIAIRANEQGRNGFRVISITSTPNGGAILMMEKAVPPVES